MDASDLKPPAFFTTNGEDIWKLESYFPQPSCTLVNLETSEKRDFGMGGLTAQSFHRIKMPEKVTKKKPV